jgi:hypothetical protein
LPGLVASRRAPGTCSLPKRGRAPTPQIIDASTDELPAWARATPTCGSVDLREFRDDDAQLAVEWGDDPSIPNRQHTRRPTTQQALEWVRRQRGTGAERLGLSFVIASVESDKLSARSDRIHRTCRPAARR